nr:hypothetical protein KS05_23880 [Rhizobium brockwellii]
MKQSAIHDPRLELLVLARLAADEDDVGIERPFCNVLPRKSIFRIDVLHNVSTTLPKAIFSDSSRVRSSSSRRCRAAIACGMPLPCEFGNSVAAR